MMELFKKALERQKAGVKAPKVEIPKEAPKQAPPRSFVAKPMPVDHQSLAAGDDTWDGVEVVDDEPEVVE